MADAPTLLLALTLLLAIFIDVGLIVAWQKRRGRLKQEGDVRVLGASSPVLTAVKRFLWERLGLRRIYTRLVAWSQRAARHPGIRRLFDLYARLMRSVAWGSLAELGLICGWAAWVARNALVFSPNLILNGGEFPNLVQTHFIWTLLPRCGLCFLWNGSINGGAPALAELSGAVLHPLVFLPVLAWGVIDGSKVTLAASLALAGAAQWKLARALDLGAWARLWSALIIVAGGHLAGKMENGNLALVLGLASAAMALAYGVDLLFKRRRRALAGFAAWLALTALSGEGYIQVGFVLSILPLLGLLCLRRGQEEKPAWKDYLLALGLAALLAGIFLAPVAHALPMMRKDTDTSLSNFPPITTLPLNLVIDDLVFYRTQILGQDPFPYTHILYIGWTPVLLALLALRLTPPRLARLMWIFWGGIGLVFLVTSIELVRAVAEVIPAVTHLRHLTVASGLAVPLIMTLAAISLEELLRTVGKRAKGWKLPAEAAIFVTAVLIMAVSIPTCYRFSQEFFGVHNAGELVSEVERLRTPTAQWVQPPLGRYDWTMLALERGMKITGTWRPWYWVERGNPPAYVEAEPLQDRASERVFTSQSNWFGYVVVPEAEYAFVTGAEGQMTPCRANSLGGWVEVWCENHAAGVLTVREHPWSGWYAWVDGQPARLQSQQWMQVEAPAGVHTYWFRYLPWDAALGLLLTFAGMALLVKAYQDR